MRTSSQEYVAADCRIALREGLTRDGLFVLQPGEIGDRRSAATPARLGAEARARARETTLADAALMGSLAATGKDGTIHNLGLSLRMVELSTGRILWAAAATGRKVWRWDRLSDIVAAMTGQHLESLAQFGASAATMDIAALESAATDGPAWAAVGKAYLRRGLLSQAEGAFEKALRLGGAEAPAQNGLGLVYVRRSEYFAKAVDHFKTAIAADPAFVEPYANLASAYLERDMTDGLRYAQMAMDRDSLYSEPYRILGNYYIRQEDDPKASFYMGRYVRVAPEDHEAAVGLGRVLLRMRAYDRIDDSIAPALQRNPDAVDLRPVLALKALALRQLEEADRLFADFLQRTTERERALYEDLRIVLPSSEAAGYEALPPVDRDVFTERFWREKDPDLTTEVNERRLEHYSRIWTARHDFGREAYPWDRRGEVYIRYGAPDYRSRSGFVPSLTSPKVQQVKDRVYAELYSAPPQGELVGPVFPIRSSRGLTLAQRDDFEQSAQGLGRPDATDVRTAMAPGDALEGESYAPVTLFGDYSIVPWESWVYTEIGGGLVFDFTKEASGSAGYEFAPIPALPPAILRSTARMAEHAPAVAFQKSVSERPEVFEGPLEAPIEHMAYDLLSFRADSLRSRLDVAYGFPESSVRVAAAGRERVVVLDRSIALADSSYARVFRRTQRLRLPAAEGAGAEVVDLSGADLEPGLYHLTLRVRDVTGGRTTVVRQDVQVPAFAGSRLMVSDLLLARAVRDGGGGPFRRGDWAVEPRPSRTFGEPLMRFYYEVYNLSRDAFGRTRYRVTTGVKHESGLRNRPSFAQEPRPEVVMTVEQTGDQTFERAYLEVDLTEARPGRNRLHLVVEDLVAGTSASKEAFFDYLPAAP
jgi:GWxTD domain-containing protein